MGILSTLSIPAFAAGLGTKVTTIGDWAIYRDVDAMTDNVSCLGTYHDNPAIQLTSDSLAISLKGRGGVQGYLYRLDHNPPTQLQLPTDAEKELEAVVFEGGIFNSIIQSKRIRF